MTTRILLAAIAIVSAFGIAAVIGPVTVAAPVLAQNMTGGDLIMMGANITGGNMSAVNTTTGPNVAPLSLPTLITVHDCRK